MVDYIAPTYLEKVSTDTYIARVDRVGYLVVSAAQPAPGALYLWSVFSERDGEWVRYAFSSVADLALAKAIAGSVDGVGPKMASKTVQLLGAAELGRLAQAGDVKALSKAAGGLGPAKAGGVVAFLAKRVGTAMPGGAVAILRGMGHDPSDGAVSRALTEARSANPDAVDEELVAIVLTKL